jgi:hypothetical protein
MRSGRRVGSFKGAQKTAVAALVVGVLITLVSGEYWHWIAIVAALACAARFRV